MNTDTLSGSATSFGGSIKETVGSALGDKSLQSEGAAEQVSGTVQKTFGEAKDVVEQGIQPVIDYVRQFTRERPLTSAAVAGVLGIAIINTLRGK